MRIQKRSIAAALVTAMTVSALAGCGDSNTNNAGDSASTSLWENATDSTTTEAATEASTEAPAEDTAQTGAEVPEGMYLSELTGEPIDDSLKDQRPIAAMVDNEKTALPHYGLSEADVVYELMNSTANDRITRFMVLVKDWESIEQLGSIRSTRPTNIMLAAEWNAMLCHDGGPYYNDQYFSQDWGKEHFSGIFSRVNNGKASEFTEYIMTGDLDSAFSKSGYSTTYNQFANEGEHFQFTPYGTEIDLERDYSSVSTVYGGTSITLPFTHNGSNLQYNADTQTYDYYEYGSQHLDAEDSAPLTFKNIILQNCDFSQLDEHGYLIYNCIAEGMDGWYLTNGKAISITWSKKSETDVTHYYDRAGNELKINTGKTYISLIPSDTWGQVGIQ